MRVNHDQENQGLAGEQSLTRIPSVNELLLLEVGKNLVAEFSHEVVVQAIRQVLASFRAQAFTIANQQEAHEMLLNKVRQQITKKLSPSLRTCINATGVIIHTNLGRAKLSQRVMANLLDVAFSFSNLEYDTKQGSRGSRHQHLEKLICELTGSEAAMVVNNNAAAVMLTLATIAKGGQVIVSRGELVEIGGSFRIPEIIELSGCRLKEVGTTNKTHLHDYENAVDGENTAAILKVHPSNYKICGFTKAVELAELATIASQNKLPLIHDMGSGMLFDLQEYGLPPEITVGESLKNHADIVTFSGDKVLGGPQAGIIVGKKCYIEAMKKNQLARVLRVDKMTIVALEATLRLYYDKNVALQEIPTLKMLTVSIKELTAAATNLMKKITNTCQNVEVTITDTNSQVGGGAYPDVKLKSKALTITTSLSANELATKLRNASIPIICKIRDNRCEFDVRTLNEAEFTTIATTLNEIIKKSS